MEVVWSPTEDVLERANVVRLMRRAGVGDYRELQRRSAAEPEWFWPLAIEDMGLEFSRPWERVFDDDRGPEWTTWFTGGGGPGPRDRGPLPGPGPPKTPPPGGPRGGGGPPPPGRPPLS